MRPLLVIAPIVAPFSMPCECPEILPVARFVIVEMTPALSIP
jgi:hypothetical protein